MSFSCKQSFISSKTTTRNQNCINCNTIVDSKNKFNCYQMQEFSKNKICRYLCLQCFVKDVEQKLQRTSDMSCETNTNSFMTAFTKTVFE
jgi:GTP-sensing pleiotropic transcriptional regulator CodY